MTVLLDVLFFCIPRLENWLVEEYNLDATYPEEFLSSEEEVTA